MGCLVVASRGVWTRSERAVARRRLRGVARRIDVLSDAEAALLGALGGRPGVLVVAGTGAIALGRDARGRWARAGGLGPLLGDEGSAFWIAREWLRATPTTALAARRLARRPDAVARIAALAPGVLRRARAGDRRARAVALAAQRHLAGHAAAVAHGLRLAAPVDVSWAGGLFADAWFRAGMRRALARRLRARWRAPEQAPVMAALALAARRCARA